MKRIPPIEGLTGGEALGEQLPVKGFPGSPCLRHVTFNSVGTHFALTHFDKEYGLRLYVSPVADCCAQEIPLPARLNDTLCSPFEWLTEDTLVAVIVTNAGDALPLASTLPVPIIAEHSENGEEAAARTYQDLLKNPADEQLFEHYCTSRLYLVSFQKDGPPLDGLVVTPLDVPARLYSSLKASPDGGFLLLHHHHRPFSYLVPSERFPLCKEVWRIVGRNVSRAIDLCDLPLAENIPISFDARRAGMRCVRWRRDAPHTLLWIEAQDGGDPKAPTEDGIRDRVYDLNVADPFDPEASGSWQSGKRLVAELVLRFHHCTYSGAGFFLLEERWRKSRTSRMHLIPTLNPRPPATTDTDADQTHSTATASAVLFERRYENRFGDPGTFVMARGPLGTMLVATLPLSAPLLAEVPPGCFPYRILLQGTGASEAGDRPFVDILDLSDPLRTSRRLFRSPSEGNFEETLSLWGCQPLKESLSLWFVTSQESPEEPADYTLREIRSDRTEEENAIGCVVPLTHNPHPYPVLQGSRKELVHYGRADGLALSATLHFPPTGSAPFPLLMWVYPRGFKTKEAAGQPQGSPLRFEGLEYGDPRHHLAEGYAVLSKVAMPIVGEGDTEPNDTFQSQAVANLRAAVEAVVARGVADPKRIAIGGHSYGASMVAHAISHSDLFSCGIARSGAFNRTLTPFGFQGEERTYWQSPDTYARLSAFTYADRVTAPLLVLHGTADSNPGTHPQQSERYYAALKGNGKVARLVLLPHESPHYRARESVLHLLYEQHTWLAKYCPVTF